MVKTRLRLGADAECAAYQQLVDTVLREMAAIKDVELRFTPDDAQRQIRKWLRNGWSATAQGQGDLGARMRTGFADAFANGAKRVVIIGSDCPYLCAEDIRMAWDALNTSDLVLGPAEDGGYWLIGLREEQSDLFRNIPWSSRKVFNQTMARAQTLGLKTFLLRTLSDVDTREDWQRFISSAAQPRIPPRARPAD